MVNRLLISLVMLLLISGPSQAFNGPEASRQYSRANRLFASSQFHEALSLYQKLLTSPPGGVRQSEIHTRIGDSYFRLSLFQNALEAYRAALVNQKESARPETQYWIAFCCFLLGRDAEAVKEFLKIPELYPQSGMWVGTAYYWAGRASERMGRKDEAATYYRQAGGKGKSTQGRFARRKAAELKEKP